MKQYAAGEQIPPYIKNDDDFFDATNAKKDSRSRSSRSSRSGRRPERGGPSGADRHDSQRAAAEPLLEIAASRSISPAWRP